MGEEEGTGSNNKDVNNSSMEELPVMSVAVYTEMPVPPTKTNGKKSQCASGKKTKRSNLLCCRIFIFSTTHRPGANSELSHKGELPNGGEHLGQREHPM